MSKNKKAVKSQKNITAIKTYHKIPPYLGFGIVDKQSIRREGKWTLANYTLNNLVVSEAAVCYNKAIYTDIWNGIKMLSSERPTLKEAFKNHYSFNDHTRSPAFHYLVRIVSDIANIHFLNGNKENQVKFFPALRLMRFRIPLLNDHLVQAKTLIEQEPYKTLLHCLYNSQVCITKLNGALAKAKVHILEFIVPLAEVYEFAQQLCHHGIIHREKHLRVILQAWSDERNEPLYFTGNEKDEWKNYGILLKEKPERGYTVYELRNCLFYK